MSKSLQKCILFAVCIALVCALGVTLFIFDGTGGAVTGQEGQASGVADAAANAYEHGTDSGRRPAGTYTPVSTGEAFYNAIKSNTQDILLTGNITLTSTTSTSGNFIWNNNSQCFMQNTPFNHKIYGAGYTITIKGPHTSSQGMQMNSADSHDYGGLVSRLERSGAIYDLKVVITKGFSIETWECYTQTWPASNVDYWLNVGGIVGYMAGGAVIDNVYVELAESSVRLASFKYNSRGSTSQYVRAGGIVGEMGSGATITNVTVNNKGLIVAGQNSGSGSHSLATERYWGAAGNVVGWAAANGGNITIDNVRTTGNGTIRSYMSANIGVGENSNITTVNFYDNFTGTYDSTNTRHNVYLNGETGSNFYVTNVYRKGTSSSAGSGAENTATGLRIANTLTVPSDSAYDIYFDATVSDRNNSLAIAFNQAPAASYEYTLVSGKGNTYTDYETTSNAIVFRNLPTDATIWKSGNNFTATLNSELLFNPDTYENPLTKYEHGYTEGQTTSSGRAIATGEAWENIFAPSANGTPSGTYYLTDDIVINGFTGKSMSGVTIDGNGKTIFVIGTTQSSYSGSYVGGLVGDFTGGTIKNVRVVYLSLAGEISFTMSTERGGRVGLLAGRITNSRIENVQVCVDEGVTVNAAASNDTQFAMGGLIGEAATGSSITGATVDLNGELNPSGKWQFLGGIVGVVQSANTSGTSATVNMENIIIRGAGTLSGNALNNNQPTFTAAVAVLMPTTGAVPAVPFVTIDGLIYDFAVTLNGQLNGTGGTGNQYACYYLFTYNYNDYRSDGWQTGKPISEYNKAVSYSNVFVNSAYKDKLAEYAGQRTNGNAAVGGAVINTVQNKVAGLENPVAAYFNPVDGADDMIFRASGSWDSDRMVILTLSDGTVRESKLETPGVNTSAKLVYAPKTLAATDNVVQLSLYENVNWPTAPAALTYNGAEQSFAFTLHTVSGTPVESGDYTVTYSVKEGNTGGLGGNNLPLNAGTYTATIELTNGMEFIDDGQGTTSPEYSLTVTVAPFKVEGNWTYNGGLTITYGDPDPSNIDQYISVSLTTSNIPGGLTAVTASGFTTDYTQGTAAGTTVNITADTYAVNSGLTAGNYDFTGITGSGSLEVQKKTLNIDPVSEEPDYMYDPHISAVYGATGDKTAVQAMLTWDAIGRYIEGNYNGEEVTFTIDKIYIAAYDEESGAFTLVNAEEVADENIASLGANSYLITVTADGGNYTVAEGQFFVYGVTPATLTVTGVTFEGGFNGVYDGQAHGVEVQFRGLVGSDVAYNFNITVTGVDGIAVTNAGDYTVTVEADEDNPNYDVGYENDTENAYTVTVEKADYDITGVTFENASFEYDGTEKTITVSGTLPTGADGIQVTVIYSGTNGTALTNAGSTAITATFATTSTNYNVPGAKTATLTVTPKDVTFAWSVSGEIVEGMAVEDVKALANETNNGGILEADTYTFGVDIGDYTAETPRGTQVTFTPSVTFTEGGDAANYNITFSPETEELIVQLGEVEIAVTQATVNTDYVNGYTSAAQFLANFTTSDVTIDGENFTVTVTKDGGEAVGFDSLLDVGEYTVTLKSSVYNNLTGTTTYDYVVTATKWTASVAAPEGGLTYDGTNKLGRLVITPGDNAGTGLEGAPVIAAYVEGGMINANAYTVTLRLQTAEGAVYEGGNFILAAASAEIEIAKRVVEISWAEDTDLIYNGTAHTLTATADFVSGESIDLNSLIAYTGDVTDGSAINAGSYTATITKAQIEEQNANYTLAAESVTQEFTISPATLTLTQAAGATLTRPYDGMVTEATSFLTETYVTITGGVSGENIYGMLNAELTSGVEIKNAGRYVITVTFNAEAEGAGNYSVGDFTSLEIVYTVTVKTITITFDGYEGLTYNGQARTLTATADFVSGENIDLDSLIAYTGDVTDGKAVNAGSYTATITKAQIEEKNANYTLAEESATQEFTISRATLTLTQKEGAQLSRVYDGTATEASAFVSETYFTVSDYMDGGNVYALFTAAVAEGLTIQNADSYTINITLNSGAEGAGNYTCEPFAISYEVTPIQWTASVTAPEGGLTYDGKNKLGSLVITPGDNEGTGLEGAPEIAAYVEGGMVNAKAYTVTLRLETAEGAVYEGGNFILAAASAEIEIAKRVVEISWAEDTDLIYNGTAHTLTATADFVSGESIDLNSLIAYTGDVTDGSAINAGSYTATITKAQIEEQNANYTLAAESVTQEFTISPATLTLTQAAGATLTRPYDGMVTEATSFLTETYVTITGGVSGENIYGMLNAELTSGVEIKNAGRYVITVTFNAEAEGAGNYSVGDFTSLEIVYTVTVKTITITFDGYEGLTYNGQARTLTATADFVSGENIDLDSLIAYTGDVTDGKAVNAGSYTATITKAQIEEKNANYTLAEESATQEFTISRATLTLTQKEGAQLSRVYDGTATEASAFVSETYFTVSDYMDGGNVYALFTAAVAEGLTIQNADSYTINITLNSEAKGADNYTCEPFAITYEVTPIQWTASVADPEGGLTYDGENKLGSLGITPGDNAGTGIEGAPKIVATVSGGSMVNAGTYTVTLQLQKDGAVYSGGNYELTADPAEIVIEKRVVEISWAGVSDLTYTGTAHTVTATATGWQNGENHDSILNGLITISGDDTQALNAGDYTATITKAELETALGNYTLAEESVTQEFTISPATVTANADTAVYGDVYTETDNALQNRGVWQFVTFNGSQVEVTVTVTGATARAGETYLVAGTYDVTVALVSGNFTFAGGNSVASTLQITPKQLNIAAQLPEDLTYTSEGIVIGLEDYASQLVGDDEVTVTMLVDGEPYVAGVTVLGAGEHTVTVTTTDTSGNYRLVAAQQTFTVEKKEVTSSITVSGETIENNSSLEIVHGENARVQNAIDNYLTQNGVEEGEYTLTVTDSAGQAADLDNISAWAPGTYTVNLGLSDNFEGGMTFTIVVQEGTTAQIPDAPVLPSTPLEDGGSSGAANWLFPLIIAIECLIAIALIVAIAVSAARRSKNS